MLLDDIAAYLEAQGMGTVGNDIFKSDLPETPDACTAIYEYGGAPPEKTFSSTPGAAIAERPRFQIVCRGEQFDYQTPRTKANDILKKLDGLGNTTIGSVLYLWVEALESPAFLDRDENERVRIVTNYEALKRLS